LAGNAIVGKGWLTRAGFVVSGAGRGGCGAGVTSAGGFEVGAPVVGKAPFFLNVVEA
jgi:hypothetical protein